MPRKPPQRRLGAYALAAAVIIAAPSVAATSAAPSDLPSVDFYKMGKVGIGGAFAGLDWFSPDSQFAVSPSGSPSGSAIGKFSSSGATVVRQFANGSTTAVVSTNAGGLIHSMCYSSANSKLYVGGKFSSLGSTQVANIAVVSPDSGEVNGVGNGVDGEVFTVFCDNAHQQVWLGGTFPSPPPSTSQSTNVALISTSSDSFLNIPFGGLNGPVMTISSSSSGDSLYFGGNFTVTYNDGSTAPPFSNLISIRSVNRQTATVGNSGYFSPLPVSTNYQSGGPTVIAMPSSQLMGFGDPNVLLCPGTGTWLAKDGAVAQVSISGISNLLGAGVRVMNSRINGHTTRTFSLRTASSNAALPLIYTDLSTGQNRTCTENCPLSTEVSAQDFLFVGGTRQLTDLIAELNSWDGSSAGLESIQVLSTTSYTSAVKGGGQCLSQTVRRKQDRFALTSRQNGQETSLTFYGQIPSAAFYTAYMTIPGCGDNCDGRTTVQITVFPAAGVAPYTINVDERVPEDTTIPVYTGPVWQTTTSFSPTVVVSLPVGAAEPPNGGNWDLVGQNVNFDFNAPCNGASCGWGYTGDTTATNGGATNTANASPNQSGTVSGAQSNGATGSGTIGGTATVPGTISVSGTATGSETATSATASLSSASSSLPSSTLSSSTGTTSPSASASPGAAFGLFEWNRQSTDNAASGALPLTSETLLTKLGFEINQARASNGAQQAFEISSIHAVNDTIFVGGTFASNNKYSNILVGRSSSGSASALASQGVNGPVNSIVSIGQYVYVGGNFTATAANGNALQYIAKWDPQGDSWSSVGGGVDGPVSNLVVGPNMTLLVAGSFDTAINANGSSSETGGFAVYDASTSEWTTTGILYGQGSSADSFADTSFIGGKFVGSSRNSVPGVAQLVMKDDKGPVQIERLPGLAFSTIGSAQSAQSVQSAQPAQSTQPSRRRWFSPTVYHHAHLRARAGPAPAVTQQPVIAPGTLAGTYWKNGSEDVTILGGNFTQLVNSTRISGVAFQSCKGLSGTQTPVTGIVRALNVFGNDLYIGGTDVSAPGAGDGLLRYDLSKNEWKSGMTALSPGGSNLTVNVLKTPRKSNTIVVAGNFAGAGSYPCPAVCFWNTDTTRWDRPGTGITSGEVKAIDLGDPNSQTLAVGGSFVLNDKPTYAALYSFTYRNWTSLDGLPGPVASIVFHDDRNMSNIFASGYGEADNSPYLQRWDGSHWVPEGSDSLSPSSSIQNLAFVPMSASSKNTAQGAIDQNRMLMASGNLVLPQSGNVSSALYDGERWHPYLIGSTPQGTVGSVSSLFWSNDNVDFSFKKLLARGLVVLVAMAIATGLILLLILLALLVAFCLRRRERKREPQEMYHDKGERDDISSTHQHVLSHVQTALEQSLPRHNAQGGIHAAPDFSMPPHHTYDPGATGTAMGIGAAGAAAAGVYSSRAVSGRRESADSEYADALENPFVDEANQGSAEGSDDGGRETIMRYDFVGPELQPGELPMRAGQRIIILDDEQSDEWWYARDPSSGREGVVPATYVL